MVRQGCGPFLSKACGPIQAKEAGSPEGNDKGRAENWRAEFKGGLRGVFKNKSMTRPLTLKENKNCHLSSCTRYHHNSA